MAPRSRSLREHFLAPRHAGSLEHPSGVGRAENRVCGDRLELYLGVEGTRVGALRYRAEGCSSLGATASLLAERAQGLELAELDLLDVAALVAEAGGLPPTKAHAPRVVERALREALADHRSRCHPGRE